MRRLHDSDCAVHNMPASPNGPCDCSARILPPYSTIPNIGDKAVAAFLNALTELSIKHKLAFNDDCFLFEMEPEDFNTTYVIDADGRVTFG